MVKKRKILLPISLFIALVCLLGNGQQEPLHAKNPLSGLNSSHDLFFSFDTPDEEKIAESEELEWDKIKNVTPSLFLNSSLDHESASKFSPKKPVKSPSQAVVADEIALETKEIDQPPKTLLKPQTAKSTSEDLTSAKKNNESTQAAAKSSSKIAEKKVKPLAKSKKGKTGSLAKTNQDLPTTSEQQVAQENEEMAPLRTSSLVWESKISEIAIPEKEASQVVTVSEPELPLQPMGLQRDSYLSELLLETALDAGKNALKKNDEIALSSIPRQSPTETEDILAVIKKTLKHPVIIRHQSLLDDHLLNQDSKQRLTKEANQDFKAAIEKAKKQNDSEVAQLVPSLQTPTSSAVPAQVGAQPGTSHVIIPGEVNANALLAQPAVVQVPSDPKTRAAEEKILINFNNVNIIEYLRFVSRITNRNFIFDEADMEFNVTIISEEPTSIANILTALLQELRIHGLTMIEEGSNYIIYNNLKVNAPGKIVSPSLPNIAPRDGELITRVFRLNTVNSDNAAALVKPLLSERSLVESLKDTNNLIVTDFSVNIEKISNLLKSVDAPNSGSTLGEYVVRNGAPAALINVAQKIIEPIAQGQPFSLVSHETSNSIFIIGSPYLVQLIIPILQRLDQNEASTRIYDLNNFRYQEGFGAGGIGSSGGMGGFGGPGFAGGGLSSSTGMLGSQGRWILDANGNWIYQTSLPEDKASPGRIPHGRWMLNNLGEWMFIPGEDPTPSPSASGNEDPASSHLGTEQAGPKGSWKLNQIGQEPTWMFELSPGESFAPGRRVRSGAELELPAGHIERTKFYIHKLQYRRGESIEKALRQIGLSLVESKNSNPDLIETINSVQWLEPSNSIVFTGTQAALDRVRELVEEIDTPLRQVFIEMLILDTTMSESLNYGVNWGSLAGGGNVATAQSFLGGASPLMGALSTGGINANTGLANIADASSLATTQGFNLGIIGTHIINKATGLQFSTIGALVSALHTRTNQRVLLNPKLLTEDQIPAEIFVGINTPFKTQSIANDQGSTITNNFQFRDVGTSMKVTPYLGPTDIITLDVEEEVSNVVGGLITSGNVNNSGGPTTSVSRTKTRFHVPNKNFLIMSGMVQDDDTRFRNQLPCLGGLPFIGALFAEKNHNENKRNLMIFIRPELIDTEDQMIYLTGRQQDCWKIHNRNTNMLKADVDEAFRWMNVTWDGAGEYDEGQCDRDRGL